MSPRRSAQETAKELRQLAARGSDDRDRLSLLHEVHVYQEELTVQNEQLTRAQLLLEETRDRYIELYDFAPNGYLSLDPHGMILRINLTGAAFIGKPRQAIEGMPLLGFVVAKCRSELLGFLRRCRADRRLHLYEHAWASEIATELVLKCGGNPKNVQLLCRPGHNQLRDERAEFLVAMIDITERKRLEAEWTRTAQERAALARRLLSVQDEERHRIARDLHDNIGQQITSLRLTLDVMSMAHLDQDARARVTQSLAIVEQLDHDLDFLTGDLRPASLDLGITAAIQQFAGAWSANLGIISEFSSDGVNRLRLKPDVETHLYRVVQEALNNVAKHASASRVSISVERKESTLVVTVQDDGCGFRVDAHENRKAGVGLIGMRERAQIVGGSIEVVTAPGEGTTICLRVPVASA